MSKSKGITIRLKKEIKNSILNATNNNSIERDYLIKIFKDLGLEHIATSTSRVVFRINANLVLKIQAVKGNGIFGKQTKREIMVWLKFKDRELGKYLMPIIDYQHAADVSKEQVFNRKDISEPERKLSKTSNYNKVIVIGEILEKDCRKSKTNLLYNLYLK